MTDLGAFTQLENFLLFDLLQRTTTDTLDFNRITASLRTNELILESELYNAKRLDPDALQDAPAPGMDEQYVGRGTLGAHRDQ